MPLRLRFYPWLLAAAVAPSLVGAEQLGWMTRDEIAALPAEEQRPVLAWCHGTYINPGLGEPDPRADTVITADRSRLTPDGLAELLEIVGIRCQAKPDDGVDDLALGVVDRARVNDRATLASRRIAVLPGRVIRGAEGGPAFHGW